MENVFIRGFCITENVFHNKKPLTENVFYITKPGLTPRLLEKKFHSTKTIYEKCFS